MSELFLDALNPPAPDQLVADLRSVGATAVGFYVLRRDGSGGDLGIGTWTPAHIARVRAEGDIGLVAIVVPGNRPLDTDPQTAMASAVQLGAPADVAMSIDLEQFSEPNAGWVGGAIAEFRRAGHRTLRYGDVALLAQYPAGDGDWVSHGYIPVRDGVLEPVPALPNVPGVVGDQYAVHVSINGHTYDASVFAAGVLTRGDDWMSSGPLSDPTTQTSLLQSVSRILTLLVGGGQSFTPDGSQPVPADWPNVGGVALLAIPGIGAKVDALLAAEGVEQAAINALAANAAAASSVAALATKLDAVLAGLPPDEVAGVRSELEKLGQHLGVDLVPTPPAS